MISIEHLNVRLPSFALDDINLHVPEGDFFTLLGPTGSGKSVLLETIAGLVPVESGSISIAGRDITALPPEKRGLSIVYQDYALFPHLSVRSNIIFGARYKGISSSDAEARAGKLAEMLNIGHLLERTPRHLSGGERQRTAIARALLVDPSVLLLDEPLSALDPAFRQEVQDLLKSIHRETGITFVMVTHDFDEALYLAGNGAIIKDGKIIRKGAIRDIFNSPGSKFVADFVGMTNIYACSLEDGCIRFGSMLLHCGDSLDGTACTLAFRPEEVLMGGELSDSGQQNEFGATVKNVTPGGFYARVTLDYEGLEINALVPRKQLADGSLEPGTNLRASIPPRSIHLF
ncbi:ABC transporter ATP-binding protein [Maridesulfovibrio sp.]|uniref:ABC transporter ATP-binding protein n=1 Tax=Maridesulfovibrio sp. TaxID=2795000 RepID=UPI002A18BEA1|nr:ABC transporter ATP-binding protein [Maridesulfovibrio sp.]